MLLSGTLVADPVSRTAANGNCYVTCSLRVPVEDGDPLLCSVIAFPADAVTALLALAKGDAVAIAGRAKLSQWEKDGEQRHGLSVTADRVMSAYAAGKARRQTREAEEAIA